MDVFEALGIDVGDNTRSLSVTDGMDQDFMQFLPTLFGWDEKDSEKNSLVMFPGESQQGLSEGALLNLPSFKSGDQGDPPSSSAVPGIKAEQGSTKSPFSGISQFDLFLGNAPAAAQPAGPMDLPESTTAAAAGAFAAAADTRAPFMDSAGEDLQGGNQLQSEFSQGLLGLLESAELPEPQPQQQQQQEQQPVSLPLQVPPATLQQIPSHHVSPFGSVLPQQLQQPQGTGSAHYSAPPAAATGMTTAPVTTPQQLVPPPLPQLPLQLQPLQQPAAMQPLQQPAIQYQAPLISPLLLQPQQAALPTVNLGVGLPNFGLPQPQLAMPQQQQFGQQGLSGLSPITQLPQQVLLQPQQQPMWQLQQPARRPQRQQQRQRQQQQLSPDVQFGDADGDHSDDEGDHRRQPGQPKRRGRPPKVPGQYSKGYEAIKRYREKKKGMVEHMEAEIAQKREELHKLQAEQEALRSHQMALESTMSNQDQLLAQLLQVKLSVAGRQDSDNVNPDLEATTAAAIAGVRQALAMQNGGDPAAEQAAAAAVGAEQRQRLQLKQQLAQKKVLDEGPVFLRRYQAYVQAVADRLQQSAAAMAAGSGGQQAAVSGPFPTFPFTLVETLSLWQLSRLAIMTRTNFAKQAGTSEEMWDDFTLNLSTGQHDLVPQDFWKSVASKIGLIGEQPVQLSAAWRLYANAMQALNEERNRLLLKLQEAAAAEEALTTPASTGAAGELGAGVVSAAVGGAPAVQSAGQQQLQLQQGGTAGSTAVLAGTGSTPGSIAAGGTISSTVSRRTGTAALDVAYVYMDVLDAVERNLLRGRAVVMMFGWSMLCMLSAEQIGLICVHSWPYFPLIRAVAGYMLGKEDLVP